MELYLLALIPQELYYLLFIAEYLKFELIYPRLKIVKILVARSYFNINCCLSL